MSLNLLLLTSAMDCGGAETHIAALAATLVAEGHRVTVASAGGRLLPVLAEAGVAHRSLPLDKKTPWALLRAKRRLKRWIKKEGFDLVHAHARVAAALASPLCRACRVPFLTTAHARFRSGGMRRRLSAWGEQTIAVSEDIKQYLIDEYRIPSHRITVIPNGIDTRRFSPGDRTGSDGTIRLLFCSRLDRDCARGAFLLCRMAPFLKEVCPTLEIRLAGGGNALPQLKRLAERINRGAGKPFVFLQGRVDDPRSLYRAADGVVGVSRVALEAMACGVPVILAGNEGMLGLSDERILPLASAGNFCCRDASPMTEEGLRREVLRLLAMSPPARERLGKSLCEYVRRHHSLLAMTRATEQVYGELSMQRPADGPADGVFCGYYGYGNMGDDALLRAAIGRAEATYPDYTLSALTRRGKRDVPFYGIRCVSRWNPFAVVRELRHAKLLVFGGGTLLQDRTSLRSLLYYSALLRFAHRRGLTVELWGNGIAPPRTAIGERLIPACLGYCHRIGLRDGASLAWALSHEVEPSAGKYLLEPDLALSTPPATPGRIDFLCDRYGLGPPPRGQAPRGFGMVALRGDLPPGYQNILFSWLITLRAEQMRLLFVPMCPDTDTKISRRLASLFGAKVAADLSPSDFVGLASRARIVCGTRLHALVFAAAAETPFVGFGNDPKIEAFCRERGGVFFTDLY